ncbi:MAG TPA: D-sedoheptulose 7-phosphate isomerase [Bacilli bacterium]|nr:D-sedoheptulose 7-phosphate isomerase [Bacilli bacterium]
MRSRIGETLRQSAEAKKATADLLEATIWRGAQMVHQALKDGGKVLFCGNGGSAADAQHLAAEFVVRFTYDRRPLAALALTTDTSILTAAGNDYAFDAIFARQVQALGRAEDVLVAISTSGNSPNVLAAAKAARERGMKVIGLTGVQGGALGEVADLLVNVPSAVTARIQEIHITIGHIWCDLVQEMGKAKEASEHVHG